MIKLQNLVFPKPGICYETEMFFRLVPVPHHKTSVYYYDSQHQSLAIDRDGVVFFDTYFNSLSIGKWEKYTTVSKFALSLDLKGSFSIRLLHTKYINGALVQKDLAADNFVCLERQEIHLIFPPCEAGGILSFRLDSLEDGSVLYGGHYAAEESLAPPRPVELALNICNYQRERYIYRNFGIIQKYILDNSCSELREHLAIFIADNSGTVDATRFPTKRVFVFPQGDFGGAGGFTRGLMEILQRSKDGRFTHVVMIDDDVLIEPESLERTFSLLRFMREEYMSAFIGGALLRLDDQSIQTCHGGEWDVQNCYVFHKPNANLCLLRDVVLNEIEDGATLNAWWFHCLPLSELSLNNLPYPFFFHIDDVEYDLRNCRQVINMNGIGVWHEPFENKPGSHLFYYNTRNVLITHMLHVSNLDQKEVKQFLKREFFNHLWIYRYQEAKLVLNGIEDALKGPQWLAAQNPEELLENILACGYKKQPMDVLPMRLDYEQYLAAFRGGPPESRVKKWFRRLTLNGYMLKADHDAIIPMYDPLVRTTYRAKRVLNYDPISDRGYVTEKSYREFFKVLFHYFKVRRLIDKRFDMVREEYLEAFPKMTSASFWRKYLGIEETSLEEVTS